MKIYLKILFVAISTLAVNSCDGFLEDEVVNIDLKNTKPRLVVEALINWEKGTAGNNQNIFLSKSSSFFAKGNRIPAIGAKVRIENSSGEVYEFTGDNEGNYTTSNFVPILNETYTLIINFEGEEIRATETMFPVPNIESIRQDELEIFGEKISTILFIFYQGLMSISEI